MDAFQTLLTMTQSQDMAQHKHTSGNCNKFYKSLLTLVPLRLVKPRWMSSPTAGYVVVPAVHTHHWARHVERAGEQELRNCESGQEGAGRHGPHTCRVSLGTGTPSHPKTNSGLSKVPGNGHLAENKVPAWWDWELRDRDKHIHKCDMTSCGGRSAMRKWSSSLVDGRCSFNHGGQEWSQWWGRHPSPLGMRPEVKGESHGYLWVEGPASAKALGWDLGARGVWRMRSEMGRRADRRPWRQWSGRSLTPGAMGNHWNILGRAVARSDDGFRFLWTGWWNRCGARGVKDEQGDPAEMAYSWAWGCSALTPSLAKPSQARFQPQLTSLSFNTDKWGDYGSSGLYGQRG